MKLLLRIWSIFIVAAKRLFSQKGLALATLVGLIVSIAITMSVPLYADAVYFSILEDELESANAFIRNSDDRSPFTFMFRYVGAWHEPVEWEDTQPLDEYMAGRVQTELGLPRDLYIRYFKTDNFRLFPSDEVVYSDSADPLAWVNFGFVSDIEDRINITEGTFPTTPEIAPDSTIEVLVNVDLATELGIQVGESYTAFMRQQAEANTRNVQVPVRVAGVWEPINPTDPAWFYEPSALNDVMLVSEETFLGRISPYMNQEVYTALWYLVMDGSNIHSDDARTLLNRINFVQQRTSALLPNVSLDVSPAAALQRYQVASSLLTLLLYAFSVPILILILTFIGLVVGLSVGRQRNEIAVLRSRGATMVQVLGIAALEGLLLGSVALAVGSPIGEWMAGVIGQTRSFLDFSAPADLRVAITSATLRFGIIAVGITLVAQVIPTISAARHTIVTYKQERARSLRPPLWQRMWLDVILLVPAVYGTYLLRQQGSIAQTAEGALNNDPFQNPLLLLVPALGIFALTLFILRLLPLIMSFLAWLLSHVGGIGILLATRQLARSPGFYSAPMLLLVLTLSLSAFTASLASTLDAHLFDKTYYEIGADMTVVELGQLTDESGGALSNIGGETGGGGAPETAGEAEDTGPRWLFLPVTEYLQSPGIEAAARVGRYDGFTRLSGGRQNGALMGVDRVDFPQVAFWRSDFAPSHLGDLMNALATSRDGVLMPRQFLSDHSLNVGDRVQVNGNIYGQRVEMDMLVVGGFDLFPTWYEEEDGPLFVTNLDYVFENIGGQAPYNVWLRTVRNADYEQIVTDVRSIGLKVLSWDAPRIEIVTEQASPERQGLFGILSVGFATAGILTVLGFLLYALFSFRQRFIELGVLRAIGLSSIQMTFFLAWELAFLILTGLLIGTGLGAWVSQLFIPFLQVGTEASSRIPPFVVEIAWPAIFRIYGLFGILFVGALFILAVLLMRMKIFQAIKLGETI